MDTSKLAWEILTKILGKYQGRGVNHEGENFTGDFQLKLEIPSKLLSLTSSARGDSGELFHNEVSWIGRDISGALTLYVCSNNHPGITAHVFHRIEEKERSKDLIFRFGNPQERESFREEIAISSFFDGSIAHHYSWGMPGGDFAPRSGSQMKKMG